MVEQIFNLPGLGKAIFVQAPCSRDYTVVMGVVICLRQPDPRC